MKHGRPKILVANRSEIACRVFQACREMGLKTVAIFAPGDEEARHLTYADEVHEVTSYLNAPEVASIAKKVSAHAVHPGYGFLSERAHFVRALDQLGIGFVGPRAESMEKLGEKISGKEVAALAGVPTLPWARVAKGTADSSKIKQICKDIGFPVLIKASAGGGGKGMRKVTCEEEVQEAAEASSREAEAAFGDGTLFIEKYIEQPRHIEVQVFGDGKGGGVHLHERECSLQRRHQKVWEEATAPHLSQKTRTALHEAALKLVSHVKYRNAGTLEFLVDAEEKFYFLEMNTRLQVEHPVSELVTGVDLVHAQLRLALDENDFSFDTPPLARGHAIEVRLYAEDPYQSFIPTPGLIKRVRFPSGPGIRVDSGVEEGQRLGTSFDSMIAKLIVYAENRAQAVARMQYALEETVVLGTDGFGTNQSFLTELSRHPKVIEGKVDTHFIEREILAKNHFESWSEDQKAQWALILKKGSNAGPKVLLAAGDGTARLPSPWRTKNDLL